MLRTRLKICGIRDVETALAAADAGADAVGLVFAEHSPRCIEPDDARRIVAALPAFVVPVGLFVDTPVERIREVTENTGIRTVQLHGREGVGTMRQLSGLEFIKAVGFRPPLRAQEYEQWRQPGVPLRALLWDAPVTEGEQAQGLTGGTGRTADWAEMAALQLTGLMDGLAPMILAGGLTPENVGQAIAQVRPFGVDVSSGVERERGVKDVAMIQAFGQAVRAADAVRAEAQG